MNPSYKISLLLTGDSEEAMTAALFHWLSGKEATIFETKSHTESMSSEAARMEYLIYTPHPSNLFVQLETMAKTLQHDGDDTAIDWWSCFYYIVNTPEVVDPVEMMRIINVMVTNQCENRTNLMNLGATVGEGEGEGEAPVHPSIERDLLYMGNAINLLAKKVLGREILLDSTPQRKELAWPVH